MSTYDESYYHRFQVLVDGLVGQTREATNNGVTLWDQVGPDTYELSLTRNSIRLYSRDGDGERPYVFELIDAKGRSVETIEDAGGFGSYVKLHDLYMLVSRGRKDKEVNNALSEVLKELNIPDQPYEEPPF